MNNQDKDYYDKSSLVEVESHTYYNWVKNIESYFNSYRDQIELRFSKKQKVKILELGAGSCTLSLLMSKWDFVGEITCLDISSIRMNEWSKAANELINGNIAKLKFVEGDFSFNINFPDEAFDIIIFDSSLHHTRSMWNTLSECKRILASDGLIIAQREAYLSTFFYGLKLNNLLKTKEVLSGVSENVYLKKQYEYYFRANGFNTKFIGISENIIQKVFGFLNGHIFSKWVIIGEKLNANKYQ
jgi:ubiquinone/menaquinone biosynthesis C-methylase UbiE